MVYKLVKDKDLRVALEKLGVSRTELGGKFRVEAYPFFL